MKPKSIILNIIFLGCTFANFFINPNMVEAGPAPKKIEKKYQILKVRTSSSKRKSMGRVSSTATKDEKTLTGQEQDLDLILATAVEFKWDREKAFGHPHNSLGTKINDHTVLTHNHFSDLIGTNVLDFSNPDRPHGVSGRTSTTTIVGTPQTGAQTMLVDSRVSYEGPFASIASRKRIEALGIGDYVAVVYWNDQKDEAATAYFKIEGFLDTDVIVLADPENIINVGDSGGGAFSNNELIGNVWRYVERMDNSGSLVEKLIHVHLVPSVIENE